MPCTEHTDADVQNALWEGFEQADEDTNLFVWNFQGDCIHAAINYLGSWHDSKLALSSGLYSPILTDNTPAGFLSWRTVHFLELTLFRRVRLLLLERKMKSELVMFTRAFNLKLLTVYGKD